MAKKDRTKVMKDALAQLLKSFGTDQSTVAWPAMEQGPPEWYGPEGRSLRRSSLEGYKRESEAAIGGTTPYNRISINEQNDLGHPGETDPKKLRAYSTKGRINIPDVGDLGSGYLSKPQYAQNVIAHEAAHNADRAWNKVDPKNPHSIETFRPLELVSEMAGGLMPTYNPGTQTGINQANEYPDAYMPTGPYKQHFYMGQNPQDLGRAIKPVAIKDLLKALAQQRVNFAQSGNSGPSVVSAQSAHASLN